MVMRLVTFAVVLLPLSFAQANVIFEGYYKLLSGGASVGYVIQQYELDPKTKVLTSTSYIKTNEQGGNLTESLKAKCDESFQPISYQYTADVNGQIKIIDASFKNKKLKANVSDGKKSTTITTDVPDGTFLATFLGYLMLRDGYKKGKKFVYKAIAEEEATIQTGEAFIQETEQHRGIETFKIFNTFKNAKFISNVTHSGEVLATRSPVQQLSTELVTRPEQATNGHPVLEKSLKLLFGKIPAGNVNVFAKKASDGAPTKPSATSAEEPSPAKPQSTAAPKNKPKGP